MASSQTDWLGPVAKISLKPLKDGMEVYALGLCLSEYFSVVEIDNSVLFSICLKERLSGHCIGINLKCASAEKPSGSNNDRCL